MGEYACYDHSCASPSTPLPPVHKHKEQPSSRHHRMVSSPSKTTRPAIRIIHIIAPEIIKTDAANFRDLVQRLTGRAAAAAADDDSTEVTVGVAPPLPLSPVEEKPRKEEEEEEAVKKRLLPVAPALQAADIVAQQENKRRKTIKCEVVKVEDGGFGYGGFGELGHGGDLWMDLNPGGFLSFLEEADVFQGMAHPDFLQPLGSSRMDFVGEMCASFLA